MVLSGMPQLNSEDAKAQNKAILATSSKSETFTWQVNPNPPPNLPFPVSFFASSRLCCSHPIAEFRFICVHPFPSAVEILHGRIKRIQLRSNDGSSLCFSRIVLVLVVVLVIGLFARVFDYDYEDEDDDSRTAPSTRPGLLAALANSSLMQPWVFRWRAGSA